MLELVVCTCSREGTPRMNEMLLDSLGALKKHGFCLVGVHLGDKDGQIAGEMMEIYKEIILESAPNCLSPLKRGKQTSEKLISGVRSAIDEAKKLDARAILYTELDKTDFISEIPKVVRPIIDGECDLTLATRSSQGFSEFPLIQRIAENMANKKVCAVTGVGVDYMYGPRAFSREAGKYFNEYGRNDWGVLTYAVVAPMLNGLRMRPVELEGFPQKDYMLKYDSIMRTPLANAAWRMIQNIPHMRAANLAKKRYCKD